MAPAAGMVFARDGRTIYFTSGNGLYRGAGQPQRRCAAAAARAAARAAVAVAAATAARGRGGGGGGATARQVTYTANIEIDRKALRAQVFNEGWRIMKNRFYDAKMHGANWPALREHVRAAAANIGNTEELQSVMMMMIGHLNASHTGVSGGPNPITLERAGALSRLRRRRRSRPATTRSGTSTKPGLPITTT